MSMRRPRRLLTFAAFFFCVAPMLAVIWYFMSSKAPLVWQALAFGLIFTLSGALVLCYNISGKELGPPKK